MRIAIASFVCIIMSIGTPERAAHDSAGIRPPGGSDSGNAVKVDGVGNDYTSAYFDAAVDLDTRPARYELTSAGCGDVLVSILDSAGCSVGTSLSGGVGRAIGYATAEDRNGDIYTTGKFSYSAEFNPGAGTHDLMTAVGSTDAFISRHDRAGNLVWAKQLGGSCAVVVGSAVAVDSVGNLYTSGYFSGTVDFDPGPGAFSLTSLGDAYVLKLDTAGDFVWAVRLGESGDD